MIAWLLLPASVRAAPDSAWTGSRWLVEIEETTPSPLELSAEENFSFRTRAIQLQAVLSCPTVRPLGKNQEVECTFDEVALRATPRSLEPGEALNPTNQEVVASLADRLRGTRVVFSTSADGKVNAVDLPDVEANNRRESESREVLRRLTYDLVAAFHLKRPTTWEQGWTEKNSLLLRAPSQPSSTGMSKTDHVVSRIDGATVIQSTGSGTFTSPYIPWEFSYEGRLVTSGQDTSTPNKPSVGVGATPLTATATSDGMLTSPGAQPSPTTPTDYTFAGTLSSVVVLDTATGLPKERVWATLGKPTASSLGNMQGLSVYYAGRLRRLGPTETVELGPTEIVAPPGNTLRGIGVWVPLTTL